MVLPKQLVWCQRPGETIAAIQTTDQTFVDLTARTAGKNTWTSSSFIGRLQKFQPNLCAWFVDVGHTLPALVSAKHMAHYAKQMKTKPTEGLYAPFTVTADAREDKGLRLMPELRLATKSERSKGPHCLKDLRDPVQRLAQLYNLDADKIVEVTPAHHPAAYTALQTAWQQAIEPAVPFEGGYLIIEPSAAITTIDVNGVGDAKAINTAACQAIGKAILARNISGQILIDFASMQSKQDRLEVLDTVKMGLADDARKLNWGGVDGFSCLLLSRQRLGPSIFEQRLQPATPPETGWRLPAAQRLIDFLDQAYRNKRTSQTWAKRESFELCLNTPIDQVVLTQACSWMAEHAFMDISPRQLNDHSPQPEFQLKTAS